MFTFDKFLNARYAWHIHNKSKDQKGKVANPARGQLNRENKYVFVSVRA